MIAAARTARAGLRQQPLSTALRGCRAARCCPAVPRVRQLGGRRWAPLHGTAVLEGDLPDAETKVAEGRAPNDIDLRHGLPADAEAPTVAPAADSTPAAVAAAAAAAAEKLLAPHRPQQSKRDGISAEQWKQAAANKVREARASIPVPPPKSKTKQRRQQQQRPPVPQLWDEAELEEHFVRGSGAGGQKINKTSCCVIITHTPTGLQLRCQRSRSQQENRRIGRKMLQEKLEVLVLGGESKAMKKVARLKKAKKRRRKRSVARHAKGEDADNGEDDPSTEMEHEGRAGEQEAPAVGRPAAAGGAVLKDN